MTHPYHVKVAGMHYCPHCYQFLVIDRPHCLGLCRLRQQKALKEMGIDGATLYFSVHPGESQNSQLLRFAYFKQRVQELMGR